MIYELWYEDTGNIIDAYKAEADALAEVRSFIEDYGQSSVETMVLLLAPDTGAKRIIAQGPQLAERAIAAASGGSRSAAM